MTGSDTAWAVVAASLGSATLSILGAFGVNWQRDARSKRRARDKELKDACILIIAGANRVALRSASMRANMFARSGITEGLDVVLHHRKPADVLEISDYLFSDFGPVLDAQAAVWLAGDEQLIRSAGDVVLAISDVIEKSSALPKEKVRDSSGSPLDKAKVALQGLKPLTPDQETEDERQKSVRSLGHCCAIFGQLVREKTGSTDIDAILRAFPGLIEEKVEGSSPRHESSVNGDK